MGIYGVEVASWRVRGVTIYNNHEASVYWQATSVTIGC